MQSRGADFWIKRRKALWKKNRNIEEDWTLRCLLAEEMLRNEEFREEVFSNPEKLIELEFTIVDKKKQVVPFFLNEVQKDFAQKINKARKEYKAGRLTRIMFLILKGRQQGFTSFITAYQLACAITQKNFEGFTLADILSNAQTIFENKAKFPYNSLPEILKPTEKLNNRKELRFSMLNSSWEVSVASNNVGRSRTINFFHGSEAAFWQAPMSNVYAALQPALTRDCIIIYESTADGFNDFKDMWDSGAYINCFYEWWRTEEYRTSFESKEKEEMFHDVVENGTEWISERLRWLKERGLDDKQMYWYYQEYCTNPDKEKIKQEYPCTAEEAFLMSGRPVFNLEKIVKRIAELKEKYKKEKYMEGYFTFDWEDPETQNKIVESSIEFVPSKNKTWVKIYHSSEEKHPYVLGGDTKGEGSDWYTATVLDNTNGKRVATLHMQVMTSKPYTQQIYCLGKYFNNALVAIEANFNTAPIEELQRLQYPKQYVRRKFDTYTKQPENRYGWRTDGNTRPVIIDKYADLIENNIELINDVETLQEAMTFVYDDNGRPDAIVGKHDDLIFSDMIANQAREQQLFTIEKKRSIGKYTRDMLEDFNSASEEERKVMIERWGNPY